MTARFKELYGSGPVHLLAVVLCLVVVVVAVPKVPSASLLEVSLWFVGAALIHDLAVAPAYSLLDRVAAGRARARAHPGRVNFLRVPVVLSGVLLLVSAGLVLERGGSSYVNASGLEPTPYLERWLAVTAALFVASALLYLVTATREKRSRAPS